MFEYLLTKLDTTRKQVKAEMPKKAKRVYECMSTEKHKCHKKCKETEDDYDDYDNTRTLRGLCCVAQGTDCGERKKKKKQKK
jgi:hypothetical protein